MNLAECVAVNVGAACSWNSKGMKGVLEGAKLEVLTMDRKLFIFCDTPIEAKVCCSCEPGVFFTVSCFLVKATLLFDTF